MAAARRAWREWLPLLLLPLVTVAVFSTATIGWERFLVPTLGVVCLFAGLAAQSLAARSRALAATAMLLALAVPASSTAAYLATIRQPITKDLALDWIDAHYPPGTRLAIPVAVNLGADAKRYEITRFNGIRDEDRLALGARDVVVAGPGADRRLVREMTRLRVVELQSPDAGERILLLAPTERQRPPWQPVDLARARLDASGDVGQLAAIWDDDPTTAWRAPVAEGAWIEVRFPQPLTLGRIEVFSGKPDEAPRNLHVYVAGDEDPRLRRVPVALGRPPEPEQLGAPSQELILDGVEVKTLRIVQVAPVRAPWSVAELEIGAWEVSSGAR